MFQDVYGHIGVCLHMKCIVRQMLPLKDFYCLVCACRATSVHVLNMHHHIKYLCSGFLHHL